MIMKYTPEAYISKIYLKMDDYDIITITNTGTKTSKSVSNIPQSGYRIIEMTIDERHRINLFLLLPNGVEVIKITDINLVNDMFKNVQISDGVITTPLFFDYDGRLLSEEMAAYKEIICENEYVEDWLELDKLEYGKTYNIYSNTYFDEHQNTYSYRTCDTLIYCGIHYILKGEITIENYPKRCSKYFSFYDPKKSKYVFYFNRSLSRIKLSDKHHKFNIKEDDIVDAINEYHWTCERNYHNEFIASIVSDKQFSIKDIIFEKIPIEEVVNYHRYDGRHRLIITNESNGSDVLKSGDDCYNEFTRYSYTDNELKLGTKGFNTTKYTLRNSKPKPTHVLRPMVKK